MVRSVGLAMCCYSIGSKIRKYVKGYGFLFFRRNLSNKYGQQLLDIAAIARLDILKTATKKIGHKAAEAKGEFLRK